MMQQHERKATVTQIITSDEKENYLLPTKLHNEITQETDLITVTISLDDTDERGLMERARNMVTNTAESHYYIIDKPHSFEEGDDVILDTEIEPARGD